MAPSQAQEHSPSSRHLRDGTIHWAHLTVGLKHELEVQYA